MNNNIITIFSGNVHSGCFIRIGSNDTLNLYVGKDDHARYCFEFRGKYTPSRLLGSDVIAVSQTKNDSELILRFALSDNELLEHFCTFCQDLVDSTTLSNGDNEAYRLICTRYTSWKKLFKLSNKKLSEPEIMGLIGELLFLQDKMFTLWGIEKSLDSWTGPEKTHKDFSTDEIWYEVKTINSGKESVTISSIEQLDGDIAGNLVVYRLEKMSPSFSGLKLTSLVNSVLGKLTTSIQKELFISKLELFGFEFSPEYDNYVYALTDFAMYSVANDFPRIKRSEVPTPICKMQYDIILSEIESYKLS